MLINDRISILKEEREREGPFVRERKHGRAVDDQFPRLRLTFHEGNGQVIWLLRWGDAYKSLFLTITSQDLSLLELRAQLLQS